MVFVKAVNPASAHHQRCDPQPRADIETARTLRAQQAFVTGKAEHVYAERLHINGVNSRRLRGIYDEQESMPFGKGRYPRQIGSISGHIGSMGDYDRLGIGAQQRFQLVVLQHTAGIDSQKA